MNIKKNILILVVCSFLVVGGCKKSDADSKLTIEEICQNLSEKSEHEYHAVSGEVIGVEIFPSRSTDCFKLGGCLQGQATFIARMKPIAENKNSKEFAIYTKLEPQQDVYKKEFYMKAGEPYVFCARKVELFEFAPAHAQTDIEKYKIDYVETIQLIY